MRRIDRSSAGQLAKLVQPCKPWTVTSLCHRKLALHFGIIDGVLARVLRFQHEIVGIGKSLASEHILAYIVLEVVDIVRMVELDDLFSCRVPATVDVHFPVQIKGLDK